MRDNEFRSEQASRIEWWRGSLSASNRCRFHSLSSAGRWVSIPGSSTTRENACGKWMRPVQAGKPAQDYHGCIIAGSTAPDFVPLSIIGYDGDGNTTSVTDSQGGLLTLTYDVRDGVRGHHT